jgi:endoglycosylceramidase
MMRRFAWLFVLMALLLGSCSSSDSDDGTSVASDETVAIEAPDPRFVVDDRGRVLMLRGVNVISAAKSDPERTGGVDEAAIAPISETFGFSNARHLIFWDAVEPEPGVYDQDYLDRVEERLDWYHEHELTVVLDMHQDIYSGVFGGDGAPEWAVETDGLEFTGGEDGSPWYLANVDPAVQAATMHFFIPERGHPELREHYVGAWQVVVERFADHPAVVGYDVMNEPSFNSIGTLDEALAFRAEAEATGNWTNPVLTGFMQQVIDGIREVDDDGWVFVEPISVIGALESPGDLGPLSDPRTGPPRLLYAPHAYPLELHDGGAYDPGWVDRFFDNREADLERLGGIGLYIGEFGSGPPSTPDDLATYITELADRSDEEMAGWSWWSWDPGGWGLVTDLPADGEAVELTDHAPDLVRPYPRAIAGVPEAFGFDADESVFRLRFATRDGVEGPTELVVPAARFPDGYEVVVTGGEDDGASTVTARSLEGDLIDIVDVLVDPSDEAYEICVAPAAAACEGD